MSEFAPTLALFALVAGVWAVFLAWTGLLEEGHGWDWRIRHLIAAACAIALCAWFASGVTA